jgi:hypothetical protein
MRESKEDRIMMKFSGIFEDTLIDCERNDRHSFWIISLTDLTSKDHETLLMTDAEWGATMCLLIGGTEDLLSATITDLYKVAERAQSSNPQLNLLP